MNDVRDRLQQFVTALPIGQRLTLGAAVVGLVMVGAWFVSWVTAPEMTVLASGLDDTGLSAVVDQLEASNTPYEIGGGGRTVMVPRDQLYKTRATLATSGVATSERGEGWELLDDQGLAVSDFQQQTNYQRALEGELSRTLVAMDGIDDATVHLVLPEDRLFTEQQEARTASVLLDTARPLDDTEVEAVVFLVSSAVEGLEIGGVTVAEADGTVLHAPGENGGSTSGASRQLRETREYEQALAADIQRLLSTATGSAASVVVRATLDFDATETAVRTFDPDSQVSTSEQVVEESYEGGGAGGEGIVGVDGGPTADADGDGDTSYSRSEVLREYGISETTTTRVQAPGSVEALSVAIVMDDGSLTGVTVPAEDDISSLVSAAVGLDDARGATIAVTRVAFPAAEQVDAAEVPMDVTTLATQIGSVLVLLVVAVALFLMSRRREQEDVTTAIEPTAKPEIAAQPAPIDSEGDEERMLEADAFEVHDTLGGARNTPPMRPVPPDDTARREVESLVEKQPEEIANLLRSWLADVK